LIDPILSWWTASFKLLETNFQGEKIMVAFAEPPRVEKNPNERVPLVAMVYFKTNEPVTDLPPMTGPV
jgi:hypothetical protein